MRRISLALALVGAAAVTGCMSGSKAPATSSDSGVQKGVTGSYYFVNLFQPPLGGIITSDVGGINCGANTQSVSGTSYVYSFFNIGGVETSKCGQTQFAWAQQVTLTAVAQGSNVFLGWAGDCSGVGTCVVDTSTNGADKTVVAVFGPPNSGHTNFMNPALHGAAFKANLPALQCHKCHGEDLQGPGGMTIVPSCNSCHSLAGTTDKPESCYTCHSAGSFVSVQTAHAITGKVTATATAPVVAANGTDLTFTVNVKVDGVNKAGLITPPPSTPTGTPTIAYRYQNNPALATATVIAPFERISLTGAPGTVMASVVDAGAGNYTVTVIGGATLTGNQTFMVRLQDAVSSPTMVYATAVTNLNGPARDLVSDQACVNCHADQVFREREAGSTEWHHGANPYGVSACVVCHTRATSISRSMGGDRLTAYVHGIHNSHEMPERTLGTAPNTVVKAEGVYARNDSVSTSTGVAVVSSPFSVGFPGYMWNCATCHDSDARLAAVMDVAVSASTCFSCHDSIQGFKNTKTGGSLAATHATLAQPAATTATANVCATCHNGTIAKAKLSDYHAGLYTGRSGLVYMGKDVSVTEGAKLVTSVDSVSYDTSVPPKLVVTWSAKQNGVAVNPCNSAIASGPVFIGATADTANNNTVWPFLGSGQSASNMSLLVAVAQGNDWVNAGLGTSPGQPGSAPTLTSTNTTCSGNVATSTITAPVATAGARAVVGLQGKPQITYTNGSFSRIIQVRSASATKEFVIGTGAAPTTTRRQIVSSAKCLSCHIGSLYQHGGNRIDSVDLCVECHNPAANEKNNRFAIGVVAAEAYDGKEGETYDLRTMIHAIHSAGETGKVLNYYRGMGIYAFGTQAAINALPNWPASNGVAGVTCNGSEGAVTYYPVYGSSNSGTVPFAKADGTCDTTTGAASTNGTWRIHNEIVIHYPQALNNCSACHINGSEQSFGNQAERMAVTMDAGTVVASGATNANLVDDVLRGAGSQSCTTCHQFGPTFSAPWAPGVTGTQLQAGIQSHVNGFGFAPAAFSNGRSTLVNLATCGKLTCP